MLLLLLFLPPLALYLIVLGRINHRPHPMMAAGTWDFAGVLFALSGFFLFGGPAFLGSLDEQSRLFWLLGETEPGQASPAGSGTFWIAVRLVYFAVVAGGAAWVLWRCRRLTSVYNVDPTALAAALEQVFQRLGLNPLRSGDSYLIAWRTTEVAPKELEAEGIQTTALPTVEVMTAAPTAFALAGRSTALQVDPFPLMRHATLRWDPADSPLRREVEKELARVLAEAPAANQETLLGGILTLLGATLFVFLAFTVGLLFLLRAVQH